MRKLFLILALLITICLAVTIKSFQPTARAGAAYAAKALCSGVFVSGLDAERVAAEEYEGLDKAFSMMKRIIDLDEEFVETSMLGLAKARAKYDPAKGCTLLHKDGGSSSQAIAIDSMDRGNFQPLPTSNQNPAALKEALDFGFTETGKGMPLNTRAIVVVKNGAVVAERYTDGIGPDTPLKGWSMNKTITGLLIGTLIDNGKLKLDGPAPVKAWSEDGDPRRAISIRHLMQMRSGLGFDESYNSMTSDAIKMLFLSPSASAYAEQSKLAHEPGIHWEYSSGTSNILAAIVGDQAEAQGQSITEYMWDVLLKPAGVTTAFLELDQGGDFVGSSYGYMGAHDWARLGMLMLRKGQGPGGAHIITPEWIQFMTEPNGITNGVYGGQTWLNAGVDQGADWTYKGVPSDMFYMSGHDGQFVVVIPSRDLVIVRLGESMYQNTNKHLGKLMRKILKGVE